MNKQVLAKKVWSKESYYQKAAEGSADFDHPAMKKLLEVSHDKKIILDMGSGEGSRLHKIIGLGQKGYGIDISRKAIQLAKKKYPKLTFTVGDLEELPYKDNAFDLVYSAFVFEHLDNPEKVIKEGIRVLKPSGNLFIVAPNFGAPNRASPPFKGNRWRKLFAGFVKDIFPPKGLGWNKVKPIATDNEYEIDWDATTEPYLGTLKWYLQNKGLKIKYSSSNWSEEPSGANFVQKLFKFLGKIGLPPFNLWGPHLTVVAEK